MLLINGEAENRNALTFSIPCCSVWDTSPWDVLPTLTGHGLRAPLSPCWRLSQKHPCCASPVKCRRCFLTQAGRPLGVYARDWTPGWCPFERALFPEGGFLELSACSPCSLLHSQPGCFRVTLRAALSKALLSRPQSPLVTNPRTAQSGSSKAAP